MPATATSRCSAWTSTRPLTRIASRSLPPLHLVLVGVGAASLATGAVFGALALSKNADSERCGQDPQCTRDAAYPTANTFAWVANVTIPVGIVAGGIGAPCAATSDCQGSNAVCDQSKTCTLACGAPSDCPTGSLCVASFCRAGGKGALGDACASAADCSTAIRLRAWSASARPGSWRARG